MLLNVQKWKYYLADYFDQHFPDLIQFGFPMDFDRTFVLGVTEDNHPSAIKYAEDNEYIRKELSFGAMMGPSDSPPF